MSREDRERALMAGRRATIQQARAKVDEIELLLRKARLACADTDHLQNKRRCARRPAIEMS
jgi:hypothetical protein